VVTDENISRTTRQTLPMSEPRRHIDMAKARASNPLDKWHKVNPFEAALSTHS
jgi:hypothetical protein